MTYQTYADVDAIDRRIEKVLRNIEAACDEERAFTANIRQQRIAMGREDIPLGSVYDMLADFYQRYSVDLTAKQTRLSPLCQMVKKVLADVPTNIWTVSDQAALKMVLYVEVSRGRNASTVLNFDVPFEVAMFDVFWEQADLHSLVSEEKALATGIVK